MPARGCRGAGALAGDRLGGGVGAGAFRLQGDPLPIPSTSDHASIMQRAMEELGTGRLQPAAATARCALAHRTAWLLAANARCRTSRPLTGSCAQQLVRSSQPSCTPSCDQMHQPCTTTGAPPAASSVLGAPSTASRHWAAHRPGRLPPINIPAGRLWCQARGQLAVPACPGMRRTRLAFSAAASAQRGPAAPPNAASSAAPAWRPHCHRPRRSHRARPARMAPPACS